MPKQKRFYRGTTLLLAWLMLFSSLLIHKPIIAFGATDVLLEEFEEILETYKLNEGTPKYEEYKQNLESSNRPSGEYIIEAKDYVRVDNLEVETYEDYEGQEGTSVYIGESGLIEYEVEIKETGLYELSLLYYPVEGKSASIQRAFFIDGKLPYQELSAIEFSRIFVNAVEVWEKDNQGNDLKPTQIESPDWIHSYLHDNKGYVTEKLSIYLTEGIHTITMVSLREPMVLRQINISNSEELRNYSEVKDEQDAFGYTDSSNRLYTIQAEAADRKSSQMLYPNQDQSSPSLDPYDVKTLKNNTIGGNRWRLVGQWIEWDFEVEESGYYYIALHNRQSYVRGTYVSRKISIDGRVPFEEMRDYGFQYKSSWRVDVIEDKEKVPYKFYLEAGKHTLRMEAVLGEFSDIVSDVETAVEKLNAIYRKVIRITGVAPEEYRDYQLEANIPTLESEVREVAELLDDVILRLQTVAGKASDKEAVLKTMRDQLWDLTKDVEKFTNVITSFRINIRACGTWITRVIEQPLALDEIYIYSPDVKTPTVNDSFLSKITHEIKSLYYSFIIDYNQIGNVSKEEEGKTITLWVGTGRDQANVIKALIDETFTKTKNINVNVMLVDMNTLLQATLAGQGPDVAIQVNMDVPMNYGLRNAVADLSQFGDLDEIKERFHRSAMIPYEYDGATYGLPETQTFLMMFYRKDILNELSLELPKTWKEMKAALSVLSKNQMDLGMLPSDPVFSMFLYQNGGEYYRDNGMSSALDSEEAINAFKEYCEYYTDYKLDKLTSVEERFRTGEAPIIIADYTVYNNLQVSAPELRGLWGFAPVPGVEQEDGTIHNTITSGGQACIMMESTKDKEASWEFLKWWTSEETQTMFAKELEGLMGAAARYPTANMKAFASLPWPVSDYEALMEQFKQVSGTPQVPGGYFTYRNIENAFYKVTTETDTMTPREGLMDYVVYINAEIDYKRKEFHMPLAER